MRVKRGKKATPRYVAEPFASLCCIDKGLGGICATLSGGNPPRYETNHTLGGNRTQTTDAVVVGSVGRWVHTPTENAGHARGI